MDQRCQRTRALAFTTGTIPGYLLLLGEGDVHTGLVTVVIAGTARRYCAWGCGRRGRAPARWGALTSERLSRRPDRTGRLILPVRRNQRPASMAAASIRAISSDRASSSPRGERRGAWVVVADGGATAPGRLM